MSRLWEQSETKTLSAPTGGYTEYGTYAGQYIYQTKKGSDTITIHVAKISKEEFLILLINMRVTSITRYFSNDQDCEIIYNVRE